MSTRTTNELINNINLFLAKNRNSLSVSDYHLLNDAVTELVKFAKLKASKKSENVRFIVAAVIKLLSFLSNSNLWTN